MSCLISRTEVKVSKRTRRKACELDASDDRAACSVPILKPALRHLSFASLFFPGLTLFDVRHSQREQGERLRINCFPQVSRALPMASLFESYQASICSMKSVPFLPECPCVQRSSFIKTGLGRAPGAPRSCQHPSILCTFISSAVPALKETGFPWPSGLQSL